ncbi:MAG: sugar phosphate isomerase/epimerase [Bacteroidales bacterium]|jgi:hexulose-6-phosphate isomerase|nr:sugar phosphate isomerase/epimerase [Bacteroidales bacterium]
MNRRQFTRKTAMASAFLSAVPFSGFNFSTVPAKRNLKIGIMWGSIGVGKTIAEKFQAAKAAGYDGVEADSHLDRNEVIGASKATGLKVHSVCDSKHWRLLLSSPDPAVREEGVAALIVALEDAKAYGADAVLLVPGRVNDSVGYDECWNRSTEEIKKAVPVAEKLNVKIAIENVWNNFLLSPLEAARFIDQFNSPFVGAYFDCGNILAYGWPEQWIRILGKRIAKIHIKEYSRKIADSQGRSAGFNVKLREGDVNWPAVMAALDNCGYNGWVSVEMPGGDTPEGLKDLCDRTRLIIET